MRIGVLTTSWPSEGCPWAGHFVADQAAELARHGHEVFAVAPAFRGDGSLEGRPGVVVCAARVPWKRGVLRHRPIRGAGVLAAMRRRAADFEADMWWCHWWPTLACAPGDGRRAVLLHGSDMDLLDRMPRWVARTVARRARVAAVAEGVARRFESRVPGATVSVLPLGARRSNDQSAPAPRGDVPRRVLTVARDAPGKGLEVARAARELCPGVHWEIITPELGLGPHGVREAISNTDLVVVPSLDGPGVPREGRPHVLAQAAVAAVPLVGGPNAAVREVMRQWGQVEVTLPGPDALAAAVRQALVPAAWSDLAAGAARAGEDLTWPVVTRRVQTWFAN